MDQPERDSNGSIDRGKRRAAVGEATGPEDRPLRFRAKRDELEEVIVSSPGTGYGNPVEIDPRMAYIMGT